MEFIDVLENIPKDKFKATANKLLNECFIIKKNKDTVSEYNFILNYRDYFVSLFDVLGYELVIQEDQGVIGINNPAGTGRIHLKKIESMLLLILRLLYIEERKKVSQTGDVIVIVTTNTTCLRCRTNLIKQHSEIQWVYSEGIICSRIWILICQIRIRE